MAVRLTAVPEIMTRSAWVAGVPRPAKARDAWIAAGAALEDARKVRLFVAGRFRGTIPPPPWPMHKELVRARRRMRTLFKGLNAIQKRAPNAVIQQHVRNGLIREGTALYRETNVLLDKLSKLPKKPGDLVPAIAGAIPWYLWAGAAYFLLQKSKRR